MAETLDHALPPEVQERANRVLELACDKECYLATAESCTGGLLAALLTDVPGCSHIFERGFVVYSDDAKCDLLGIARSKVENCGAVSEEVAREMALGALRRSEAQLALSITGYAGPRARIRRERKAWSTSRWPTGTAGSVTARSISARSDAMAYASPRSKPRSRCWRRRCAGNCDLPPVSL